jgi:hypothetical protein
MMPFFQGSQAVLVPALSPVLDTVKAHCKLVCYLLQRLSLAQPHNGLSPHPGTWMAMKNAHVAYFASFHRGQFRTFHAVSFRKLLQTLTAIIAQLLSTLTGITSHMDRSHSPLTCAESLMDMDTLIAGKKVVTGTTRC